MKKLTPIVPNNIINRQQTINTFKTAGNELKREFTTNLNPSFLLITLRGLSALNALNDFKDYNF